MDAICLIAAPRTGTNHLCEVLRNFSDLASYLELFELNGAHGTDPRTWPLLRRFTGVAFENDRDPALIAFTHERPGAWLDAMEAASQQLGKRFMTFKLFRHNLPLELIEREIMPRPGLRVIFVVRRQVDSYVSWIKALHLGTWKEADTTGLRPTLDPDAFELWLDEQESWYRHWQDYLKRRFLPCPVLRYETDIDQPPERILRRFAAVAAQVGIALRLPAAAEHAGMVRQDRSASLAEKVANWAEFNREIFARGLERRAFGYPI